MPKEREIGLLPAQKVVPRNEHAAAHIADWHTYSAATAGYEERVYFFDLHGDDLDNTHVLLKNASGTRGVSLQFNRRQFPCFIQWKNTTAAADGCVTGIEPATNFPNTRSFEGQQGRLITLDSGESRAFDVTVRWHHDSAEITAAEKSIQKLQGEIPPQTMGKPLLDWCEP